MSSLKEHVAALRKRREQLRLELEAAKARFEECDSTLRVLEGQAVEEPPAATERKSRRGNVKDIVLSLLEEAAESGLSSHACVNLARERHGVELHPGSVSSLLSRLKADDIVFYDGDRYRMKQYAGPRSASTGGW